MAVFNMDYHMKHWETDDPDIFISREYHDLFCVCDTAWVNNGLRHQETYLDEPIAARLLCRACRKPLRLCFVKACSLCKQPAFLFFVHPNKGQGLFDGKGWVCDKCYEDKTGVPCTYGRPGWFKPAKVKSLAELMAELDDDLDL